MGRDTVPAAVVDGIAAHRAAYLRSGGAQGHVIVHAGAPAGYALTMNLLVRLKGRKTGRILITPLSYGRIGEEVVIVASKGGADEHPSWYLNLREATKVEFQIATQAFRATWREPEGTEREKIWTYMVDCYPFYAEYQASTSRVIPLVLMKPTEEISVFQETDIPRSI
jgi:deazaflavin-dependent oxidoreductase (nitroreductase family)